LKLLAASSEESSILFCLLFLCSLTPQQASGNPSERTFIRAGALAGFKRGFRVRRFAEKPCLSRAFDVTSLVSQEENLTLNSMDFFSTVTFFVSFFMWQIKKEIELQGRSSKKWLVRLEQNNGMNQQACLIQM